METFIQKIAKLISEKHAQHMEEVLVIFPNRRPAVFLQNEMKLLSETAIWMPDIISIDDFVFQQMKLRKADNVEMMLELFSVHQEVELKEKQSFDRFVGWAQILLSDFNELDLYVSDHEVVFRYLEDAKNIANWRADGSSLSALEKSYVEFFGSLKVYYNSFRKKMLSQNCAWQGLAYRLFAEQIKSYKTTHKHIIFAGFNALTPSEEIILKHMHNEFGAEILWDADTYYLDNLKHEAGNYMRYNLKEFPKAKSWVSDDFSAKKDFHIHALAGSVAQVKWAGQLLQNLNLETNPIESIAVVLPDEDLLIPLLGSVPKGYPYNITMSLSIRNSLAYKYLLDVLEFQQDVRNEWDEEGPKLYALALENLLLHPFITLYADKIGVLSAFVYSMHKTNHFYITSKDVEGFLKGQNEEWEVFFKKLIFTKPAEGEKTIQFTIDFLSQIALLHENDISKIEKESIHKLISILEVILSFGTKSDYELHALNLKTLLFQMVSGESIPFEGKPLQGVQIMGMLESRNIDFDHLIILSANEGVLPRSSPYQSFLLFELRQELGLPLPREKDDIFAYHFYRLMQRAKTIHLLYNTETNGMGEGEASRYIKQLQFELHKYTPNKIPEVQVHSPKLILSSSKEIEVIKNQDIIEAILKRFKKGFSASSLSQYANCPLQFYYAKVLGVREPEQMDEVIPPNVLGTIVHDTLEELYLPFENEMLSKEILENRYKQLDEILEKQMTKHYTSSSFVIGKNILLGQVVRKLIDNVKKEDLKSLKKGGLHFIGAEKSYTRVLDIEVNGTQYPISFYGIIDRIDKQENIRFVDYKTGKVDGASLKASKEIFLEEFDGGEKPAKKMAFQLMMYAWLYSVKEPFKSFIMALKTSAKHVPLLIDKDELVGTDAVDAFEDTLKEMVGEILDVNIPFVQTKHEAHCAYCDFKQLCHKIH